ncbi:uncharacterized protein DFE_3034 [Desulfovibrio ferrophilus]|uniref:Uncharacterized protein n=1 Tax=Desulfovibrio ferrophilus TaxID=241368 RepID=A0A2Z6B2X1_9BACT|nr:uncharacterized protein DFE_3034 [Desulfovibrio ferrophilus]
MDVQVCSKDFHALGVVAGFIKNIGTIVVTAMPRKWKGECPGEEWRLLPRSVDGLAR